MYNFGVRILSTAVSSIAWVVRSSRETITYLLGCDKDSKGSCCSRYNCSCKQQQQIIR